MDNQSDLSYNTALIDWAVPQQVVGYAVRGCTMQVEDYKSRMHDQLYHGDRIGASISASSLAEAAERLNEAVAMYHALDVKDRELVAIINTPSEAKSVGQDDSSHEWYFTAGVGDDAEEYGPFYTQKQARLERLKVVAGQACDGPYPEQPRRKFQSADDKYLASLVE